MESICIENQKNITIKGATKIISATNTQAIIDLGQKNITIQGTNLEITKLNLEEQEVCFSGSFTSLKYATKTEKPSFLKRLFK